MTRSPSMMSSLRYLARFKLGVRQLTKQDLDLFWCKGIHFDFTCSFLLHALMLTLHLLIIHSLLMSIKGLPTLLLHLSMLPHLLITNLLLLLKSHCLVCKMLVLLLLTRERLSCCSKIRLLLLLAREIRFFMLHLS